MPYLEIRGMRYDYIVIGAGVSGMSTAIVLAKNGHSVALVERSRQTAPLIRGFSRNDVYFDTGFHFTGGLGDGEILDVYSRYLGLADHLEKDPYDPECSDFVRCLEPDFEFRLPYGYDRIRERLKATFPGETNAVNSYLKAVRETYYSYPYVSLDVANLSAGLQVNVHGPSLKEFLDRLTDNRALKCVLSIHCMLYGVPPEETRFANHAGIVGSHYESVHGIKGGGSSLAGAFDLRLESLGVHVFCGRGVKEILFSSDLMPSGICLDDGDILHGNGVVSTIHPRQLLDITPVSLFRPAYRKRLERIEETSSAHILYAGCNSLPAMLNRSNVWVTSSSDLSGLRVNEPFENRPLFVSSTCQNDKPNAKRGLIAVCPTSSSDTDQWSDTFTGKRPKDYALFKEEIAARIRGHVEATCPEVAGKISFAESATPLTLRDFANSPFGSLYGAKHKVGQRNPMPLTRSKGLFLAGQAVVAPGILGAVISAFLACGFILGHERLLKDVMKSR